MEAAYWAGMRPASMEGETLSIVVGEAVGTALWIFHRGLDDGTARVGLLVFLAGGGVRVREPSWARGSAVWSAGRFAREPS